MRGNLGSPGAFAACSRLSLIALLAATSSAWTRQSATPGNDPQGQRRRQTYVGPGPSPAGADDREVLSFDDQVLILKWVDPETAGRYGTMVLV